MTHGNITVSGSYPWRLARTITDTGGWLLLSLSSFSLSLGKDGLISGMSGFVIQSLTVVFSFTTLVSAPVQIELVLGGRSGEILLRRRDSREK